MATSKDQQANADDDVKPVSQSGSFQRMPPGEAGAILGTIGGAGTGTVLCKSHGILAAIGGAIGGGIVGLFAGALLVLSIWFACAFAWMLAKLYWEVLTGRRKLSNITKTPETHRRRLLGFIAVVCIVDEMILAGVYFAGTDAQRLLVPAAAVCVLGVGLIGLIILAVRYHRHPFQKDSAKDE